MFPLDAPPAPPTQCEFAVRVRLQTLANRITESNCSPITTRAIALCASPDSIFPSASDTYGAATHHYAPVCLNSLLFKTERDLEKLSRLLGKTADALHWQKLAATRKLLVQKYLWNESQRLFFDYDFQTQRRSDYRYATTFYPLWAGLPPKPRPGP